MIKIYCSFCGKSKADVFYMIEGPGRAGICDECVMLAADIIQNQRGRASKRLPSFGRVRPVPISEKF